MEGPPLEICGALAASVGGAIRKFAGRLGGALTGGALAWATGALSGVRAAGAVALLAGSRIVPHRPQKRKLLELTSPHLGQITGVLRIFLFLSVTPKEPHSLESEVRVSPECEFRFHIRILSLLYMPMAKAPKKAPAVVKTYSAPLEHLRSGLGWVIAYLPFDAAGVWGSRGRLKVRGEINGFAFRTSLFPTRDGRHFLLINKRMQKGAHAVAATVARFRLEPDTEERMVTIPAELKRVLAEDRSFLRWYDRLNYSTRKWIADWIGNVKSAAARVRRAEQVAEQLLSTMEAERELPPMLQLAFARNPRAREGWEQMSASRRRGHLIAIFYYRTPESRARRLSKTIEEAAALAERKAIKSEDQEVIRSRRDH